MMSTVNDAFAVFPQEICLEIFLRSNLAALGASYEVCTAWNQFIKTTNLFKRVIYRDIAFGSEKWENYFGNSCIPENIEEEISSLPLDILNGPCSAFPGKRVWQTHVLVRILKTFTLKNLKELLTPHFSSDPNGVRGIWTPVANEQRELALKQSFWVLMTKQVLIGSEARTYEDQQRKVELLALKTGANYQVPTALEVFACMIACYIKSASYLFYDGEAHRFTNCQEFAQASEGTQHAIVGIDVWAPKYRIKVEQVGIAALVRFPTA